MPDYKKSRRYTAARSSIWRTSTPPAVRVWVVSGGGLVLLNPFFVGPWCWSSGAGSGWRQCQEKLARWLHHSVPVPGNNGMPGMLVQFWCIAGARYTYLVWPTRYLFLTVVQIYAAYNQWSFNNLRVIRTQHTLLQQQSYTTHSYPVPQLLNIV